jgi:hypothetical protein
LILFLNLGFMIVYLKLFCLWYIIIVQYIASKMKKKIKVKCNVTKIERWWFSTINGIIRDHIIRLE